MLAEASTKLIGAYIYIEVLMDGNCRPEQHVVDASLVAQ